uniref:Pleckstrin homology domain containing S1, tandem duplicate 3 n=1 Tax=Scophthalmus maximus TaxID=52904 RepID=A0A8D3DUT2_SCOMX
MSKSIHCGVCSLPFLPPSLDHIIPEERDIEVKQADLKKHLTLTEVDGKPSVCGWTGQPQTVCLFHMGDHILAINDLHIDSVKEPEFFFSFQVKLTILRLPGCSPLHSPNCVCNSKSICQSYIEKICFTLG